MLKGMSILKPLSNEKHLGARTFTMDWLVRNGIDEKNPHYMLIMKTTFNDVLKRDFCLFKELGRPVGLPRPLLGLLPDNGEDFSISEQLVGCSLAG